MKCRKIRPRNIINWQNWKYTLFLSQLNIRRHNELANTDFMADVVKNIGLKLQFQSSFSILLILHKFHGSGWIII